MPLHKITKLVEFCYGHRLLDYDGKCCYLHGHNGLLEVDLEAHALDSRGILVDFARLRDLVKGWVDENLDHRMLLWSRDPVVPVLAQMGEPLYLMDDNPTAENIAKHIYHAVHKLGLKASEVRLWETSSSYATYQEA